MQYPEIQINIHFRKRNSIKYKNNTEQKDRSQNMMQINEINDDYGDYSMIKKHVVDTITAIDSYIKDEELKNLEFIKPLMTNSSSEYKQKNGTRLNSTKNSRLEDFHNLLDDPQNNVDENLFIAKYNNTVKTNILRRKLLFSRIKAIPSKEILITPLRKKAQIWFRWGKLLKHALTEVFYLNINQSNQIIKRYHSLSFWNIINYNISMVAAILRINQRIESIKPKDSINKSNFEGNSFNIPNISSETAYFNTYYIKNYQTNLKCSNDPFFTNPIPSRSSSKSSKHSKRMSKNKFE